MELWTGPQSAFALKAFYINGESLGSLSVNFVESSRLIVIVLFHQPDTRL
jgi:hypothetical protein